MQTDKRYDLLIKNGRLVDAAAGLDTIADLAVSEGRIALIQPNINSEAGQLIDASDCVVTPGLVDFHMHFYPLCPTGVPAEAVSFACGVTAAVDAGSTGCENYETFRPTLSSMMLNTRCFLNVAGRGLADHPALEDADPEHWDRGKIHELLSMYFPGELLGLKLRTSREIVRELGWTPLREAAELAHREGVPLVVHCTDPPGPMDQLLAYLDRGDIVAHAYHNIGYSLINEHGCVIKAARTARERGVLFDAAHDRRHFGYSSAASAIADNFLPDIISSDLTALGIYRYPTVHSMPMLAARYMAMGLSLQDILLRMSTFPARAMGIADGIGLEPGKAADIAVFRIEQRTVRFSDRPVDGSEMTGSCVLTPMLTLKGGLPVFRDNRI